MWEICGCLSKNFNFLLRLLFLAHDAADRQQSVE